ncbi:MAG: response regulator [Candidatus Levybacteria bacterium]|nr:response regulator [Candidatus Levybacteria bacterium]
MYKHLKTQALTKHIPIIIISANKDTKEIATECGADDFITKPFQMDDLLSIVTKYTHKLCLLKYLLPFVYDPLTCNYSIQSTLIYNGESISV